MTFKRFNPTSPENDYQELQRRLAAAVAMAAGSIIVGITNADASEKDVALTLVNALTCHLNHCPPPIQNLTVNALRQIVAELDRQTPLAGGADEPRH